MLYHPFGVYYDFIDIFQGLPPLAIDGHPSGVKSTAELP